MTDAADPVFADIKTRQRQLLNTLPTTYEYLRQLHGR
jgi:tryptophan halogenase